MRCRLASSDIAKTLADGGKEVVTQIDKRVTDVANIIDMRAAKLADTVDERIANIDIDSRKGRT